MLSQRIASLEQAVASGARELKPELESLKSISRGIANKALPLEELARIGALSFEAALAELVGRKEIDLLAGLSRAGLDKEKRKLLNKALHRLKSRGAEIPEKAVSRKITFPSRVLKEWTRATPAMIVTGEQLLYYFASGTMGTNFMICHLDPEDGIQEVKNFHLNESQAKKIISNARAGRELRVPVLEIPKEHFLWRIQSAEPKTKAHEPKTELRSFLEKFLVKTPETIEPEHPILKSANLEKIQAAPILGSQMEQLLEHIFFRIWEFDAETLNACKEELKDAELSPIQIGEAQRLERMEKIFERHAEAGVEKNSARLRFGLLENAYLLKLKGEAELAEVVLKLAVNLDNKYESGEFFKKILLRSFPEAWKVLGKKGTGLIIAGR